MDHRVVSEKLNSHTFAMKCSLRSSRKNLITLWGTRGALARIVNAFVTVSAKWDRICFIIVPGLAPKLQAVDLQILHSTAPLTSPTIASQELDDVLGDIDPLGVVGEVASVEILSSCLLLHVRQEGCLLWLREEFEVSRNGIQ